MGNLTFNWIFFAVYCAGMIYLGYVGFKRTKSDDDFSVGGRTFGLGTTVPLFGASFVSAASIIGFTGFAYGNGWAFIAVYPVGLSVGWLLLQLMSRKLRASTAWHSTPQLFGDRYYSTFVRSWISLLSVVWMFLFVVIGLMGVGVVIGQFLGVTYATALLTVGVIFLLYTIFGGMFSVAWTNIAQFIIMMVGTVVAAFFGISKVGGFGNLMKGLGEIATAKFPAGTLLTHNMGGQFSLLYFVGLGVGLATSVAVAMYYHRVVFSAKDNRTATSFIGLTAPLLMLFYLSVAVVGWSTRVLAPNLPNNEAAFPTFINMLPPVIAALVLSAVASAVMSSIDNQLLAAGVMTTHDLYKGLINPGATHGQMVMVSRVSTAVIGVGALVVALIRPTGIIQLYNFFVLISSTTLFVPLILGLYWKRTTREAGVAGTIVGFAGGLLWFFYGPKAIPATLPMLPLVLAVMVLVSLMTAAPPREVVERFHSDEVVQGAAD